MKAVVADAHTYTHTQDVHAPSSLALYLFFNSVGLIHSLSKLEYQASLMYLELRGRDTLEYSSHLIFFKWKVFLMSQSFDTPGLSSYIT